MNAKPKSPKGLFRIRYLIHHPTATLQSISEGLQDDPDHSWQVGEERKTPAGRPLGTKNRDTMWSKSYTYPKKKDVFACLEERIDGLLLRERYISRLIETGGEFQVIINISGENNIGGLASIPCIQKITKLKVRLGLEVFPSIMDDPGDTLNPELR